MSSDWIVRASYAYIRQLAFDEEDQLGFDLVGNKVHGRYQTINSKAKQNLSHLRKIAREVFLLL